MRRILAMAMVVAGCGRCLAQAAEPSGPPVILDSPHSLTIEETFAASFQVVAAGAAPLTYQWWKDATNLLAEPSAMLQLSAVTTNDAGGYAVVVSNPFGAVTSLVATLTVRAATPPAIVQQPQNLTVREGDYASFEVFARGTTPLTYQWLLHSTNNGVDATNAAGASTLLQISSVTTNSAGDYTVVVTNVAGAVTSVVAQLTVRPSTPRQLRVAGFAADASGQVAFPIELTAQGNENRVAGSLAFAKDVLLRLRARPAVDAAQATLTPDLTQVADGRLGFTLAWPSGTNAPAGTLRLVEVVADLADGRSITDAALAWGDQPVAVQAQDSGGTNLFLDALVVPALRVSRVEAAPYPQTGLFIQTATLINSGGDLSGVQVLVYGVTNDLAGNVIAVKNAAGRALATDTAGALLLVPYLQYGPLAAGATVDCQVQYYIPDRQAVPAPTFQVLVVPPAFPMLPAHHVPVDRALFANGRFLIEFQTGLNIVYTVQYKDGSLETDAGWKTALPSILGTGTRYQWIDSGPPGTASLPTRQWQRFYRVIWQ